MKAKYAFVFPVVLSLLFMNPLTFADEAESAEPLQSQSYLEVRFEAQVRLESAPLIDTGVQSSTPLTVAVQAVTALPTTLNQTLLTGATLRSDTNPRIELYEGGKLLSETLFSFYRIHEDTSSIRRSFRVLVPMPTGKNPDKLEIRYGNTLLASHLLKLITSCNYNLKCERSESPLSCADCFLSADKDGVCNTVTEDCDPDCQSQDDVFTECNSPVIAPGTLMLN